MNPLEPIYYIAAFAFGITFGSFLNVCIHRVPLKLSVSNPGSACPQCKNWIKWFDNIPILSWLILRGKCRYCSLPISPRYLFIELLTGLFFLLYTFLFIKGLFFSANPGVLACHLLLVCILITCSIIDLEKQIIPNRITLPGTIVGLVLSTIFPDMHPGTVFIANSPMLNALVISLSGALFGAGLFWALAWIGSVVTKKDAMGGGDIKLMLLIGAFLGPLNALLVFYIASVLSLPTGLFALLVKKKDKIPYGPYLAIASIVVTLCYAPIRLLLVTYLLPVPQ